jgi:hypothetical protein
MDGIARADAGQRLCPVDLHRARADAERLRDFLVRHAQGNAVEYPALLAGERGGQLAQVKLPFGWPVRPAGIP